METLYYTRRAMAGWFSVAVLLGLLWAGNSPQWEYLAQLVQSSSGGQSIIIVILGAIIGMGAPPSFGFALEIGIGEVLWRKKKNMWRYPCVERFGSSLANVRDWEPSIACSDLKSAAFHVFFYNYASSDLLNWTRRRRAQMFASFTSALAILIALMSVIGILVYDNFSRDDFSFYDFSFWFYIILLFSIILITLFTWYGWRELRIHEQAISAWVSTEGTKVLHEFAEKVGEK